MIGIWFPLCMATLAANFMLTVILLRRLETHHGATWELLGKPKLGDSNLSPQWLRLLKWLWMLRFRSLNDFRLSRIAYSAILGELLAMGSFIGLLTS